MLASMHSFSRRGMRSRRFPQVTREEVATFLALSADKQFEDLRSLRIRAAHLNGGSLGAFAALYVGVILVAFPLLGQATAPYVGLLAPPMSLTVGLVILVGGCWIAYSYIHEQRDMAHAATRLAFYEEALQSGAPHSSD